MAMNVVGDASVCPNCGDGSGWHRVKLHRYGRPVFVWSACADCNDDEQKQEKPPHCERCGLTFLFCVCGEFTAS